MEFWINNIFYLDKRKACVYNSSCCADIAQLVELLICNQWVGSSSLSVGTIKTKMHLYGAFFVLNCVDCRFELPTHLGRGEDKNCSGGVIFDAGYAFVSL